MSDSHLTSEEEFWQYASLMKFAEGQEMTGSEIVGAIAAMKNSLDIVRNLADAKDEAKNSELIRAITSMNLELSKLEGELATKNRRISELEEKIAQKERMQMLKRGRIWYSVEDDLPCCKNCSDKNGRIVYLDDWMFYGGNVGYECPECDRHIGSES